MFGSSRIHIFSRTFALIPAIIGSPLQSDIQLPKQGAIHINIPDQKQKAGSAAEKGLKWEQPPRGLEHGPRPVSLQAAREGRRVPGNPVSGAQSGKQMLWKARNRRRPSPPSPVIHTLGDDGASEQSPGEPAEAQEVCWATGVNGSKAV